MSEPDHFLLRWRGQITGPHTWTALQQKLDDHEIGLFHEIQYQGRWVSLGDYLRIQEQSPSAPVPRKGPIKVQPSQAAEQAPAPAPVESVPASAEVTSSPPLAPSPGPLSAAPRFRPKNLKLFILLGVSLGFIGAHNFYAGYWVTALFQLLVCMLTFWFGFGFFVPWLWAFIELLLVHTDARGVRMI